MIEGANSNELKRIQIILEKHLVKKIFSKIMPRVKIETDSSQLQSLTKKKNGSLILPMAN